MSPYSNKSSRSNSIISNTSRRISEFDILKNEIISATNFSDSKKFSRSNSIISSTSRSMSEFDVLKIEVMSDQISLNSSKKSSRSCSITSNNSLSPNIKNVTINENITREESEDRINIILIGIALLSTILLTAFFIKLITILVLLNKNPKELQPVIPTIGEIKFW